MLIIVNLQWILQALGFLDVWTFQIKLLNAMVLSNFEETVMQNLVMQKK